MGIGRRTSARPSADAAVPLVTDRDATLIEAHSEKQHAAPTFERGFGFHPLWAFIDHGGAGTGEPAAVMLRPGNAGSNTAHDHKQVLADATAQLPRVAGWRIGRKVLVRADSGGGTHEFLDYCQRRRVQYSIGFGLSDDIVTALNDLDPDEWIPALHADGHVRDGAWVAEVTGIAGRRLACGCSCAKKVRIPVPSCGSPRSPR